MGVLERWDERNQAWADRKRAEPPRTPWFALGDRWSSAWFWTMTALYVFVAVGGLAIGAWVTAAIFGAVAVVRLGFYGWARRQEAAT
jgi:hypothetical protein